jgi:phosphoribosyl 1,2-cyclic phosphodiesterase/DNA-binding NarL/FixJ family response regulator
MGRLPRSHIVKTALLIDHDHTINTVLSQALQDAGWRVLHALGGENALSMATQHSPALVVCDLLMPRFNGYQICRALRASKCAAAEAKIIVVSASTYATDRQNALEAGADEFVIKPFRAETVLKLADELIGRAADRLTDTAILRKAAAGYSVNPLAQHIGHPPRFKFWGVRGSIATPGPGTAHYGGNTSCIEVRADGEIIVLDAGTGIRQLGRQLVAEFKNNPIFVSLLITHTHWDHIQGFPFFIPAYNPINKIRIMGYEGASSGLQSTLSSQMESPYFPISMHQMPSHLAVEELHDFEFNIGKVRVKAMYVNHPGICVGYRLNTSTGSIAYLPDNEPYSRLRSSPNDQSKETYEALAFAQKQDEKLLEFIHGVDVLIIDSQYDAAEYQTHIGWGHGCVDDIVAIAVLAKVKKLFLFHHDPDHDDAKVTSMTEWAKELMMIHGESIEVEAAREGVEVVLQAKDVPAHAAQA